MQVEVIHVDLWGDSLNGEPRLCLAENLGALEIVDLCLKKQIPHLVQYNSEWFHDDLQSAAQLASAPDTYFLDAGRVLLGGVDKQWTWFFSGKSEKAVIKDRMLSAVADISTAARESLVAVFEELFMNATIDAPREGKKVGIRREGVPSRLILTRRGTRICLSCEDPYGALSISSFVERMRRVYSEGAGEVINLNAAHGGAGLGCVLLFDQSAVLALGVYPQHKTCVSCVIPWQLSHRQRDLVKKSLHWIEMTNAECENKKVEVSS